MQLHSIGQLHAGIGFALVGNDIHHQGGQHRQHKDERNKFLLGFGTPFLYFISGFTANNTMVRGKYRFPRATPIFRLR